MSQEKTEVAIRRCWTNGAGLKEAQLSLSRTDGINIDREAIRHHFIVFADEFAGQGAK